MKLITIFFSFVILLSILYPSLLFSSPINEGHGNSIKTEQFEDIYLKKIDIHSNEDFEYYEIIKNPLKDHLINDICLYAGDQYLFEKEKIPGLHSFIYILAGIFLPEIYSAFKDLRKHNRNYSIDAFNQDELHTELRGSGKVTTAINHINEITRGQLTALRVANKNDPNLDRLINSNPDLFSDTFYNSYCRKRDYLISSKFQCISKMKGCSGKTFKTAGDLARHYESKDNPCTLNSTDIERKRIELLNEFKKAKRKLSSTDAGQPEDMPDTKFARVTNVRV